MLKFFTSILLILIVLTTGCQNNDFSKPDYEIQILNDIMVELLDKSYFWAKDIPPLPPPPLDTSSSDYQDYLKIKDRYNFENQNAKNDTSKILLAICDSLISTHWRADQDYFNNQFFLGEKNLNYKLAYDSLKAGTLKSRYLDLSSISSTGRYKLVHCNFNPKTFWDNDSIASGYICLSRIYLNQNKDEGVLYYEYFCDPLCAEGFLICVKNIDNKWKIENIIPLWMA